MHRINPALFSAAFMAWVHGTWPKRPDFVDTCGKTSLRSHGRTAAEESVQLAATFATTSRLVLGQQAVPNKANGRLRPKASEPRNTAVIRHFALHLVRSA